MVKFALKKIIRKAAAFILMSFFAMTTFAQQTNPNNLSPCPKPDLSKNTDLERIAKWSNCWGRYQSLDAIYKGEVREGEFFKGKLNGQGVAILANGSKYVGEFKNGLFHGRGILTLTSFERFEGIFENGSFKGENKINQSALNNNQAGDTNSAVTDSLGEEEFCVKEVEKIEIDKFEKYSISHWPYWLRNCQATGNKYSNSEKKDFFKKTCKDSECREYALDKIKQKNAEERKEIEEKRIMSTGNVAIKVNNVSSECLYSEGVICYVEGDNFIVNTQVQNNLNRDIKDIAVVCDSVAESGTVLSRQKKIIYKIFQPKIPITVQLSIPIKAQTETVTCSVTKWEY